MSDPATVRALLGELHRRGLTFWRDGRGGIRVDGPGARDVLPALAPHLDLLLRTAARLGPGEELWANALRRAVARGDDEARVELTELTGIEWPPEPEPAPREWAA